MSGPGPAAGRTLVGAAALIAGLTVLARLAGFGRILVFGRTVGTTCLGDTYQAVNTVPNIVFEVVAGGALASLVVPLLARAAETGDWSRVRDGAAALLTWTLLVLIPLAVLVAAGADPLARVLLSHKTGCGEDAVRVGATMLRVFAPQVPLYGVGVVLTGVLQASRRFGGPALAPLPSSMVVIAAYLTYAVVAPRGADVANVSTAGQLVLSVGTTLGVAALTLSLVWPAARAGLRARPRLRFPPGMAVRAGAFAGAAVVVLAAQQAAVAITLILGNAAGVPTGRMTVFVFAQTVFLLPWAVVAVPVATSVFGRLTATWESGDRQGYARLLAASLRAVVLGCALATAVLVAAAHPIAAIVVQSAPGAPSVAPLAAGIAALAPGLVGYGMYALLSRALYAQGRARAVAGASVAGWAVVVLADLLLARVLPPADRVLALAWGNSVGMTALALLLTLAVAQRAGSPAFAGLARVAAAGLCGGVLGGAAGLFTARVVRGGSLPAVAGQVVLVVTTVLVIFTAGAWWLCRADLVAVLARRGPAGG
ncbi:MAG: lipid II flippase MurJ [Pseudonocardiales bacterium]